MSTSKIKVDLLSRSFEIEVPDANVDGVLAKIEKMFSLTFGPTHAIIQPDESPSADSGAPNGGSAEKKRKRGTSGSKPKSYQLVDLGLTPQQRQAIQQFYNEKSPVQQNDQVAVLGVKLKEQLKRDNFSIDEIHSAFKVINKPTPRNLLAVFGNMKRDGRAGYSDNKVIINSYTDDHVQFHMKKEDGKKGKSK